MHQANEPDLRRIRSHPDFWYPVALSRDLAPGRVLGVSFSGEPIVLGRADGGSLLALEDRCAHRQVPLHSGVVCGAAIKCGYHGWTYDSSGSCIDVPYLGKDRSLPNGVRSYPSREAYGLVFVYPGDPARQPPFPPAPAAEDPAYKTRYLSRRIRCHYTFMQENLMDMNHQFLHRSLMGGIRPKLLGVERGEDWVEACYTFARVSGAQSFGEKFMLGPSSGLPADAGHDVMRIRTQYPYQILTFSRVAGEKPALSLWLAYVPVDSEQRVTHCFGLMSIRKPSLPGLIHLFWPFIVWFTDGIFAQDQRIMEQEQRAHDLQGGDWNQEIFPLIRELRELLRRRGQGAA